MTYKISDKAVIIESNGEMILIAESIFFEDNLIALDSDSPLSPNFIADYFSSFQGSTSGYTSGGLAVGTTDVNTIDKFPFSSDTNAADVGDLTQARRFASGQSSDANGYTSGGYTFPPGTFYNTIDKFPFAVDGNASDVGDLTATTLTGAGHSLTSSSGYVSGGGIPSKTDIIQKFPFSVDANATDVGDLTVERYGVAGQSSATNGYTTGGYDPDYYNVIDKFPFSSDANATDVGNLTIARRYVAGQSSGTNGYTTGGYAGPPPPSIIESTVIDKFPFSTDANAGDVGDLTQGRSNLTGQSSQVNGYTSSGLEPSSPSDVIDKFPFSSDANATDVGNLTQARHTEAGQQV